MKVGKSHCKEAFAGGSGNDEDAPEAVIVESGKAALEQVRNNWA
jgi:hypothetical protein